MVDTAVAITVLVGLAIFVAIMFVLFLICREIVCWYFKINEHLDLQRAILAELQRANPNKEANSINKLSTGT
nr:hypothetical protein BdHM001_36290 [Bdellovibrio sp. HM001]